MWQYNAEFLKAVDGDTVDLEIDLGFKIYAKIRVRLLEVDTPERGQENYREATDFVTNWFREREHQCVLKTKKSGKYGRWLAVIYDPDYPVVTGSLNEDLLMAGLAKEYGK